MLLCTFRGRKQPSLSLLILMEYLSICPIKVFFLSSKSSVTSSSLLRLSTIYPAYLPLIVFLLFMLSNTPKLLLLILRLTNFSKNYLRPLWIFLMRTSSALKASSIEWAQVLTLALRRTVSYSVETGWGHPSWIDCLQFRHRGLEQRRETRQSGLIHAHAILWLEGHLISGIVLFTDWNTASSYKLRDYFYSPLCMKLNIHITNSDVFVSQ